MTNAIRAQILGHDLHPENDHKVDFHLRSKRGRTVMTIAGTGPESRERAEQEAKDRNLDLFRVTIITEKL